MGSTLPKLGFKFPSRSLVLGVFMISWQHFNFGPFCCGKILQINEKKITSQMNFLGSLGGS
jgi:hypothetical protein